MKKAIVLIALLCSSPAYAKKPDPVPMIDAEAAKQCVFKGTYSSLRLGMSADKLIASATRDAGIKAAKAGATSGVFLSATPQGSFMMVVINGYVCGATQ